VQSAPLITFIRLPGIAEFGACKAHRKPVQLKQCLPSFLPLCMGLSSAQMRLDQYGQSGWTCGEPTCMMLKYTLPVGLQRAVDQADSGMSQVMDVRGMGNVAAIGAYHGLEGSVEG
jgi:hypothetical protein